MSAEWNLPKFATRDALRKQGGRRNRRFENDTTRIERWRTTISPGQKFKESRRESSMFESSSLQFLYCIEEIQLV